MRALWTHGQPMRHLSAYLKLCIQVEYTLIHTSKVLLAASGVSNSTKPNPLILLFGLYLGMDTYTTLPYEENIFFNQSWFASGGRCS